MAGICEEGILPSAPNDATPLIAAILDPSILLLKALQSVEDKYPFTDKLAAGIEIALIDLAMGAENVSGAEKSAMLLVAAVPRPKLVLAAAIVDAPVPPLAIGNTPAILVAASIDPANCSLVIPAVPLISVVVIVPSAIFAEVIEPSATPAAAAFKST
jgi:hypothetical protein